MNNPPAFPSTHHNGWGEPEKGMTFQEWVKALPEKERYKFFEAMIAVSEAGRKAGVPPQEWARTYVDVHNEVHQQLKEKA